MTTRMGEYFLSFHINLFIFRRAQIYSSNYRRFD